MHLLPARFLAVTSLACAFGGCALALRSPGSLAGLVLLAAAVPLAVAGWAALGFPVRRRACSTE